MFIDRSNIWHSGRHTSQGYSFEGEEMPSGKFEIAKDLIFQIPADLIERNWKGFYTTGNKNEDNLIIAFETSQLHRAITINDYEIETEKLPVEVMHFRHNVERTITLLT